MNSTIAREFLRKHVVGLLALFIALSGTAIAADHGPTASSSVFTTKKFKKLKQRVSALETKLNSPAVGDLQGTYPNLTIRNNAVTTNKIANAAVSTTKIADLAVTTGKLAELAVTNSKLADLSVTTQKLDNDSVISAKILNGQVRAGDLGPVTVRTRTENVANGGSSTLTATNCNGGETAFSGGGQWIVALPDNVGLQTLAPLGNQPPIGWLVRGRNQSGGALDLTTYVVCLAG